MKKITPFRAAGTRKLRKLRTVKDQPPPTRQAEEEEGMVTIKMKDGTWETIRRKNLEMDIEYREGFPYLVVRERR